LSDFDFEPIPGLPANLPHGESLLWQGSPDWGMLARHVFHVGIIGAYFAVLIAWKLIAGFYDGAPLASLAPGIGWTLLLAGAGIGILCLLAWAMARTTIYSITSKRVVLRHGVALPMALNIPFRLVESAAARIRASGHGDLPIALRPGEKISYIMLWPHARPGRFKHPQPMLRGIPDAANVADILARALAAAASDPAAREAASAQQAAGVQRIRSQLEAAPASPAADIGFTGASLAGSA
jgi:hypothetical protein